MPSLLLLLLNPRGSPSSSFHTSDLSHRSVKINTTKSNVWKRYFLKCLGNNKDPYSVPYGEVILSALEKTFLHNSSAFKVLGEHLLSVLQVMFKDEALRYFTNDVKKNSQNISGTFELLEASL